ncbi:MAG: flagellar basal body rod protein FlgB [Bdellovibrionales bacterium]
MEMNGDGLIRLLTQKMSYLNQRQSVLSENVANADTPTYKARDLAPFTFNQALKDAGFKTTNVNHIIPASMAGVNAHTVKAKSYETLPSGNSVDIEQQMMQVSETAINYQTMTSIYKKISGWFRIVLKGN